MSRSRHSNPRLPGNQPHPVRRDRASGVAALPSLRSCRPGLCTTSSPWQTSQWPSGCSATARLYGAVAEGQSVLAAYDLARVQMELDGLDEADLPVLECRPGVDPAELAREHPGPALRAGVVRQRVELPPHGDGWHPRAESDELRPTGADHHSVDPSRLVLEVSPSPSMHPRSIPAMLPAALLPLCLSSAPLPSA